LIRQLSRLHFHAEVSGFASPPHDEFAFINPVGLVFDRWALGIETDGRTYDSTAR